MNENQWLTSTDPQAMYAFVKDQVTERQHRFFVEECRRLCVEWQYVGGDHYKAAFNSWCTGLLHRSPILPVRADLLREIIGNPFRKHYHDEDGLWIDRGMSENGAHKWERVDWLQWSNATVPNLIRAMMEEECQECYGKGWFVPKAFHPIPEGSSPMMVNGVLVPRTEPQWDMTPILADALEEAGCTEAAILDHLRGNEPCPHCNGDGARFYDEDDRLQCKQRCDDCNGTGKRPVKHVRGCWVVELLSRGMQ